VKLIVRGAAIRANRSAHGSTIATFATQSSTTATAAPRKPTTSPSITNGQRMNQLVAPTSRITSTSRRRAKIERRIVFATSRMEASTKRPASAASRTLMVLVADRIFCVSSSRSWTSLITGLM
jgi:hypothetical protein